MNHRKRIAQFLAAASLVAASGCGLFWPAPPEETADTSVNRLVETTALHARLGEPKLVVVDARPTNDYLAGHIPGAVSASFTAEESMSRGYYVSYGGGVDLFVDANNPIPFQDGPPEQIQAAVRRMGINQDDTVVIYDNGADFHAGRFFNSLARHGFKGMYLLNGGLGKWRAEGLPTSQEVSVVAEGNFVAHKAESGWIASTDDVLNSMFDPNVALVSGLLPSWQWGSYLPYTVPGHIPGTRHVPLAYFFNSDRTWKSPEEVRKILNLFDITPDKTVITYCGGGPLSACMHTTFKYILGYPNVLHYSESYLGWIWDPRELPVDTYHHPDRLRDSAWLRWWAGDRIQILLPVPPALVADVRSQAAYQTEHIPWSVNLPLDDMNQAVSKTTAEWANILGAHGIDARVEVVAADDTVTPSATFLFWLLEYLGQDKVSIASEGITGWRAAGHRMTSEETPIAAPITPIDVAVHPTTFTPSVRPKLRLAAPDAASDHPFSRVWVVSAKEIPDGVPVRTYQHVPWSDNLTAEGRFLTAGELWTLYENAQVPYLSEIVCYSDNVAEATMTYYVLRHLLSFPKVMVYLPAESGLQD